MANRLQHRRGRAYCWLFRFLDIRVSEIREKIRAETQRESTMRWYSETMDCLMALKFGISSEKGFDKTLT